MVGNEQFANSPLIGFSLKCGELELIRKHWIHCFIQQAL